ncbi:MAG: hypothetical protein R2762_00775 [Bryobacteraceae bacterium]
MRTTIEIPDQFRARLLEISGQRGQKGFSSLIVEALEIYLHRVEEDTTAVAEALALRGSLSARESEQLRAEARSIRENWR